MPPNSPHKPDFQGVGANQQSAEREVIMGQHSGSNEGQTGLVPLPEQLGESLSSGAVRPESATLGHHQTTTNSSSTVSVEVAEQSVASSYYFNDQDTMVQQSGTAAAVSQNSANPVLFVDDHVSPGMCWLGAEVQVENKIARRCSYEEMVHEDTEEVPVPTGNGYGDQSHASDDIWYQAVLRMTQWAITLQEVHDERSRGSIISSKKCLCHKASAIGQKLTHLATLLLNQLQQEDASSGNKTDSAQQLHQDFDLMKIVDDVQSALRAGVSIQISKPHEAVISKTVSVVDAAMVACDKIAYVQSAVESIVKLVDILLNVPTCGHANNSNLLDDSDRIRDVSPTRLMEQDEEEDIRSRVASMFQNSSGNSDDEDTEDSDEEDSMETGNSTPRVARKRKQLLKSGGAGSGNGFGGRNLTSPTSSPSKRPRKLKSPVPSGSFHYGSSGHHTPMSTGSSCSALGLMPMSAPAKICQTSPALDLLENKKKVQRNSLYHWVLWREALRGEKDRTNPNSPMPLPRSRLSFN